MKLDRDERNWWSPPETALAALPEGFGDLDVDFGGGWSPMVTAGDVRRVLIAGPDLLSNNPDGTVTLPLGRSWARIRTTASPQIVVDRAGVVDVETVGLAVWPARPITDAITEALALKADTAALDAKADVNDMATALAAKADVVPGALVVYLDTDGVPYILI